MSTRKLRSSTAKTDSNDKLNEELECAVCLQICIHPVKLPCSHIFCFLCVKGVANQSKRCAMCRQEIPPSFLDNPNLLSKVEDNSPTGTEAYQWFYEGRNGWWQYDERTNTELESAYNSSNRSCEVLVAGFLYTIDFDRMIQHRRNDPSRRRRIKRDLASIPKKGIAGLKTDVQANSSGVASNSKANPDDPSTTQVNMQSNDRLRGGDSDGFVGSVDSSNAPPASDRVSYPPDFDRESGHQSFHNLLSPNSRIRLFQRRPNQIPSNPPPYSELDNLQLLHSNIRQNLTLNRSLDNAHDTSDNDDILQSSVHDVSDNDDLFETSILDTREPLDLDMEDDLHSFQDFNCDPTSISDFLGSLNIGEESD